MFKRDDLIAAIMERLAPGRAQGAGQPGRGQGRLVPAAPAGRRFLSEYEVRRRLTADARELRIPKGAIVSPLALEWLSLKGIRIVEE